MKSFDTESIKLLSGYGKSLEDAKFFGLDASAWTSGDTTNSKGYQLKFHDDELILEKEWPYVVNDCYLDSDGNTFFRTEQQNLIINGTGKSKTEIICPAETETGPLSFYGSLDDDDFCVVTASSEYLFCRKNGQWTKTPLPEEADGVNSSIVLSPKTTLLATAEGFIRWDGSSFKMFAGVEDEIYSLTLVSKGKLLAVGSEGVYTWTLKNSWKKLRGPFESYCIGNAKSKGSILIPSSEGVVKFDLSTEKLKKISDYSCVQVIAFAEHQAIALGSDSGYQLLKF